MTLIPFHLAVSLAKSSPIFLAYKPTEPKFYKKQKTKMPPKIDPSELKILKIKTVGGEAGAASSLAPKLGPLGLNAKKVGEDLAKETAKWKGIKVMVEMKVQNRAATLAVVPSAAP